MQNQTTHHKGKQEERQVGRQAGRQEGRQAGRQRRQRRQNIGKVDTPSNTEKQERRQWETRGRQDLGKVDAPCNTMGGNENQDFGKVDHPTQAVGRQWETIGGNRRQWETMGNTWRQPETRIDKKGDKGRQDFGKADTPSNTGTHVGTMGDNSETRRREGGHTIQHRCTHAGRQWERMGSNAGPGETRP